MGVEKTYRFLSETFYIKNCKRRVARVVRYCKYCLFVKGRAEKDNLMMNQIICKQRGHKVFVDLIGELPNGRCKWVFIMLDGFTKHVKLYPIANANARVLLQKVNEYVKEFGSPEIISDNGRQFTSEVWRRGLRELNVGVRYVSIFHPQSNMSERYLKEVGRVLRTYVPHCNPTLQKFNNGNYENSF